MLTNGIVKCFSNKNRIHNVNQSEVDLLIFPSNKYNLNMMEALVDIVCLFMRRFSLPLKDTVLILIYLSGTR